MRAMTVKICVKKKVHHIENADTICKKWRQQHYEKKCFHDKLLLCIGIGEEFIFSKTNQTGLGCEVTINNHEN